MIRPPSTSSHVESIRRLNSFDTRFLLPMLPVGKSPSQAADLHRQLPSSIERVLLIEKIWRLKKRLLIQPYLRYIPRFTSRRQAHEKLI